jgi:hypothetical protein
LHHKTQSQFQNKIQTQKFLLFEPCTIPWHI